MDISHPPYDLNEDSYLGNHRGRNFGGIWGNIFWESLLSCQSSLTVSIAILDKIVISTTSPAPLFNVFVKAVEVGALDKTACTFFLTLKEGLEGKAS